jgi:putative oxidoreductase
MLDRVLPRYSEYAYAALRVVAGLMFAQHGAQKLFGVLGGKTVELVSQRGLGGIIELTCGLLIAVGLVARWAAFLASGTMAVAYFQFHWKLQTGDQLFPVVNRGELAVMYCFFFFYVACRGAGIWSLDRRR